MKLIMMYKSLFILFICIDNCKFGSVQIRVVSWGLTVTATRWLMLDKPLREIISQWKFSNTAFWQFQPNAAKGMDRWNSLMAYMLDCLYGLCCVVLPPSVDCWNSRHGAMCQLNSDGNLYYSDCLYIHEYMYRIHSKQKYLNTVNDAIYV